MKYLLIILGMVSLASLTTRPKHILATTYYISQSIGSDANNGTNQSTPWKTLAKLNSITLVPGDVVSLKAGDTWNEALPVNQSGNSGNVIRYTSYGAGAKPIVTGFVTLTAWTNLGGNKWEKAINAGADVNEVLLDGVFVARGRWPDYSLVGERGYEQYEDGGNTTTLTDNELVTGSGISNWQANLTAEVVVRTVPWELDRSTITGQSGTVLTFSGGLSAATTAGSSFFIQNDIRTLTQNGEWFYQANTKITMYSGTDPSGRVKISTIDDLCNINGKSYITVENIRFEGGDKSAIHLINTDHVTIQYNDVQWIGQNGMGNVDYSYTPQQNLTILGNNISYCNNTGIDLNHFPQNNPDGSKIVSTYAHSTVISNNIIRVCGFLPGIGLSGGDQYDGLYVKSDSAYVGYNIIDSAGGSTLTCSHSRAFVVERNFLTHWNLWTEDIGALYTSHVGDNDPKTGIGVRLVQDNIGDNSGVDGLATIGYADRYGHERGLYLDETADHVIYLRNTFCNTDDAAAELHRTNYVTFKYNTLFNAKHQQLYMLTQAGGETFTGMNIVGNIFYARERDQHAMDFINWSDDVPNWKANGGAWDSNYYASPKRYAIWQIQHNNPFEKVHWDLTAWKNNYPTMDVNSIEEPYKYKAFNATTIGGNKATITSYTNAGYYNVIDIGAITGGKQYLLKFNVQASARHNDLRFVFYEPSGNFVRSDEKYSRMPPVSTPDSIILTATQSETSARLYIYCQRPITYTLSNLDVREISTFSEFPIIDSVMIVYNATNSTVLKDLPGDRFWKDVKGTRYSGEVTLLPWTSVIVRVDTGTLVPFNPPPVVSAGIDYTIRLPINSVTVTGTATDNVSIASRLWTRIAGPTTPTFGTPTALSTTVSGLVEGVYQLKFSATDNQGATSSDTMQITVLAANMLPTANAGYDLIITLPIDSVYLNGSLSNDPDGTLSYLWTKTSGSSQYTMTGATTPTPKLTNLKAGTYVFTLTVTDNDGAQSADDVTIIVVPSGVIQWGIPGAPRKIIPK